jgi:uncharacterized membrane-anchored protein
VNLLRRGRASGRLPGVVGPARLDRRTKHLTRRIGPGEVAVIDHVDLDRASADALVARRVAAVVNASPSTSGRYPNLGPEILLLAGIPLLDAVGDDVFREVHDGDLVRLDGDCLHVAERVVARGRLQDEQSVGAAMAEARAGLATQLEAFAANTMEYLLTERDLLLDGVGVPDLRTDLEGRHAVVVVRSYDYREDLRALRPYIREHRPVLIGVDGGADALCEAGLTPDLVVGDMDSVSDEVLRCGAEVVVHADPDGRTPGLSRVQDLGVPAVVFPAAGTSEDMAMLLADEGGAQLIVAVGTHATLVEFLDKGRQAMASTFLTRLRIGSKLVDAKGVSRLHRHQISVWSLLALVLATLLAMAAAVQVSPVGGASSELLTDAWASTWSWVESLL